MKSFDKVKNDETGKIEDIYDVDTDILRSLDVRKIMQFKEGAAHFPIYYVSDDSMRGFDLGCMEKTHPIHLYIMSAFNCPRHKE